MRSITCFTVSWEPVCPAARPAAAPNTKPLRDTFICGTHRSLSGRDRLPGMQANALKFAIPLLLAPALTAQNRAAWMPQAQWGVMSHYLADWKARDYKLTMSVDQWNKMVDGFDVEGLAAQLQSAGAKYYQISIGQNSGYYLAPNAAYDRIVGIQPSKCSRRDLVADLYEALNKRGIRLMVYLPSGAPAGDKVADAALEWRN